MTDATALSVTHICEHDTGGGAMMAAHRLHRTLGTLGVDSQMIVRKRFRDDPSVNEIRESWAPGPALHRARMFVSHRIERRLYKYRKSPNLELFSRPDGPFGADLAAQLPPADIYHLHWTHHLVDHRLLFRRIGGQTPLVWRLADMFAYTGGCHYTLGCEKYRTACTACPQLGATSPRDPAHKGFHGKKAAYAMLDPRLVRIVGPSKWMCGEAAASPLLGRFEAVHIATGVDCAAFAPGDQAAARRHLGLPEDKPVLLFVSDAIENHRKGLDLLAAALEQLPDPAAVELVAIGKRFRSDALPARCRLLGRFDSSEELALAYNAASLFVHPARADNLPNTVLEAKACGTPVIAFDVGGLSDVVRHGETGWLAPAEDVGALSMGISTLLADDDTRAAMGARARALMESEFEVVAQAAKYKSLYEELRGIAQALKTANTA